MVSEMPVSLGTLEEWSGADPRFLRLWTHVRYSLAICIISTRLTERTGGWPGGQSEYVRVPYGEVNCLKVPKGVAGMSNLVSMTYANSFR